MYNERDAHIRQIDVHTYTYSIDYLLVHSTRYLYFMLCCSFNRILVIFVSIFIWLLGEN